MHRLFATLLLFCCLAGAAIAQDITVTGVLVTDKAAFCIVKSPEGKEYLARAGETLGEYTVVKIDPSQVVLSDGSSKLPLRMAGEALPAPCLRLKDASLPFAIRLVCEARGEDMQVAPDVKGKITLLTRYEPGQALAQVLEGTSYGSTSHKAFTIVAQQAHLKTVVGQFEQNLAALSKASAQKVSFSFVEADLKYFCQICAKEMKVQIEGAPLMGSVTCRVKSRPAAQSLALACALQVRPIAVSLRGTSLSFR